MGSDNARDYGMNLPTAMVIASFATIAWVNTIELQIRIWWGFKRYTGLYFWSLLAASWGCAFHALGFVMLDFRIWKNAHIAGVEIGISWWCMVTGQALVLYSRLYLVVRNKRRIQWVLVMIITNFFILHIPIMLLSQIGYSNLPTAPNWLKVYKVYEKIQMTGFTIQETIISGLYLWETRKILRPGKVFQRKKTRQVMVHLVWVNVFIIFLDMALLATEYANLFSIQTVFKAAIYSLKLRFEFVVLNQLKAYVQGKSSAFDSSNKHSSPYATGRTIPLNVVNIQHPQDRAANGPSATGERYSVSATKGGGSKVDSRNVDGVLRTTEVVVHDSTRLSKDYLPNAATHDPYTILNNSAAVTAPADAHAKARGRPSSPSSSEVDFAGRGA
ncbi:MAG: hypothetical protein Q9217_005386 [Psora testacea]